MPCATRLSTVVSAVVMRCMELGYHERLTKAETDLQRALGRLAVIHDITQDPNVSALDKVDNIAATAASALSSQDRS